MTDNMEWKDTPDWSGLPDMYVTRVRVAHGMFYQADACSVPMVTVPEVRLIEASKVTKMIADAVAAERERCAKIAETFHRAAVLLDELRGQVTGRSLADPMKIAEIIRRGE